MQVADHDSHARRSDARLAGLEARLSTILSTLQARDVASSSSPGGQDVHSALTHIQQLSDQSLVELQSLSHKVDQSSTQHSAANAVLQAKAGELVDLARGADERAKRGGEGAWAKYAWIGAGVLVGWVLTNWREKRKRDDVWGARKLI